MKPAKKKVKKRERIVDDIFWNFESLHRSFNVQEIRDFLYRTNDMLRQKKKDEKSKNVDILKAKLCKGA